MAVTIEQSRQLLDEYLTIEHHGIKGMRWGVRKQKEPGTERPRKPKKVKPLIKQFRSVAKARRSQRKAAKRVAILSNEELQARIDRLRKEKELRELTESEVAPGRKAIKDFFKDAGKSLGKAIVTGGLWYVAKSVAKGFKSSEGKTTYDPQEAKKSFTVQGMMDYIFSQKKKDK